MEEVIKELNALDFEMVKNSVLKVDEMARKRSLVNNKVWNSCFEKESMIRQKAKQKWLVEGDLNSKFFHKAMNQRFIRNSILGVYSTNSWVDKSMM